MSWVYVMGRLLSIFVLHTALLVSPFSDCEFLSIPPANGQASDTLKYIPALVDFSDTHQVWDGFGFNYVETGRTRDYAHAPQDHGGYSLLTEEEQKEVIHAVFDQDGLAIEIVKMFLDPWHQPSPDAPYDHEGSTRNMLAFVEGGIDVAGQQDREIEVITTLYGPPAWATKQGFIGGRDLNPDMTEALMDYMLDWVQFLRERDIPVRYLSPHNEGEDFYRWDFNDGTQRLKQFDYNMYWPPEQVNEVMIQLAGLIQERGIKDLGVTNGEPSNWTRFFNWGYAHALAENEDALNALSLLTTHGFVNGDFTKMSYGAINSSTVALLRAKKPDLKTWITSYSWGAMDATFVKVAHEHIYHAGVNALIPWAGMQNPSTYTSTSSNLGNAITVHEDGSFEYTTGYYLYKQLTQAGRRGMKVARTMLANAFSNIIAFAGKGSGHPDAFVVTSTIVIWGLPFEIELRGTEFTRFKAYRTHEDGSEQYAYIGTYEVQDGRIHYDAPRGTVTTFIGTKE